MCPVHTAWPYFEQLGDGSKPFDGISAAKALSTLRDYLQRLGVPESHSYRTHDLRRGHADDLSESGASLIKMLTWGEWRSPAYMSYLNLDELEARAVLQAHVDESSSEDGEVEDSDSVFGA